MCACVCDWRTGLWFSETPHCGSVATGVAVPPLLLDDDSLVIAGVVWWLRHFLVLLAFPLRVGSDAHARLVRLRQRREVRVTSRAQKTLMAVCFLLLFAISVYCISVIVLFVLCIFFVLFYLHRVDNDGESRVVPLAAALLRSGPGTFTTSMDGADSEHAQDHHDHQETHTHHDDDGGRSRNHWEQRAVQKENRCEWRFSLSWMLTQQIITLLHT